MFPRHLFGWAMARRGRRLRCHAIRRKSVHRNAPVREDGVQDGGSTRMTESPPRVAVGPQGGPSPSLLEIDDVGMRFGGIVALDAVTFSVAKGRLTRNHGTIERGTTTPLN